jgi:hypothetical protein
MKVVLKMIYAISMRFSSQKWLKTRVNTCLNAGRSRLQALAVHAAAASACRNPAFTMDIA